MNKPYLIIVNNLLYARTLTHWKAKRITDKLLQEKGLRAEIKYDIKQSWENEWIAKR